MTGLSKITDKILEQAREDARARLADADKQCAEISASYERRAEKMGETGHGERPKNKRQKTFGGERSCFSIGELAFFAP